jgi:hypothetical protein
MEPIDLSAQFGKITDYQVALGSPGTPYENRFYKGLG